MDIGTTLFNLAAGDPCRPATQLEFEAIIFATIPPIIWTQILASQGEAATTAFVSFILAQSK